MAPGVERPPRDDVLEVVRTLLSRARGAATGGADLLGGGVADAVRALVDRRVQRALQRDAPASAADVVLALSADATPSPLRVGRAGAWLARRGRAARFIGGRTPAGLALRFGPGLYEAVARSVRGLDAAAAHLVARAREAGVEPHPHRVRAAVVQALTGDRLDPAADPDHTALVRLWLADAGRRVVPFGLGRISGFTRGRTPEAVAAALASVDVGKLGGR